MQFKPACFVALNPGFPFWILSYTLLQSCETKPGMEILVLGLLALHAFVMYVNKCWVWPRLDSGLVTPIYCCPSSVLAISSLRGWFEQGYLLFTVQSKLIGETASKRTLGIWVHSWVLSMFAANITNMGHLSSVALCFGFSEQQRPWISTSHCKVCQVKLSLIHSCECNNYESLGLCYNYNISQKRIRAGG